MPRSAPRSSFDDKGLGEFALKSLERVLIGCYRPGAGVAHCYEPPHGASVRGLLDDQMAMADAQLDAYEATGNIVYEMMAQELAHYAVRTMWDERGGGFFDRCRGRGGRTIGRMRDRVKPFVANCEAGGVLQRLAAATGDQSFAALADAALAAVAPQAAAQGPLAAHYLLAPGGSAGQSDKLRRTNMTHDTPVAALRNIATQLRIDSIASTTEAGSGHPTTCMSAAEIVATLFFGEMRFDPKNPQNPDNDRFVLSKGHAAPILYAAWAAAGLFPRDELLKLRRIDSDLEGHPTPRLPFVDVATGSLGQGICAAVGTALNARRIGSDYRTYVLLGDGEMAEGSVWEAANVALYHKLDNLCGDHRRQRSRPEPGRRSSTTTWTSIAARWNAFGWHTVVVDGHDIAGAAARVRRGARHEGAPDDDPGADAEGQGRRVGRRQGRLARQGVQEGRGTDKAHRRARRSRWSTGGSTPSIPDAARPRPREVAAPDYAKIAGRRATSRAIRSRRAKPGAPRSPRSATSTRASSRSTPTSRTRPSATASRRRTRDRFFQNFIAEQVMVGAAMGLAARGAIPFPSTFACFLTPRRRLHPHGRDFECRHRCNVKLAGSHAGVSIGEDGPSQMALEDLAMMRARAGLRRALSRATPSAPSGWSSRWRSTTGSPTCARRGRRPPIIYGPDERFPIGGSKVLRQSATDVATVVGAGVTVFEALQGLRSAQGARASHIRVIDAYSVQPIDAATLIAAGKATNGVDHHGRGSLRGRAGSATRSAKPSRLRGFVVRRLAVREIPAQRPARRAARSLRHLRPPHRRRRPSAALITPVAEDRAAAGVASS